MLIIGIIIFALLASGTPPKPQPVHPQQPKPQKQIDPKKRMQLEQKAATAQSIIDHYEPILAYYQAKLERTQDPTKQIPLMEKIFTIEKKLERANFDIELSQLG